MNMPAIAARIRRVTGTKARGAEAAPRARSRLGIFAVVATLGLLAWSVAGATGGSSARPAAVYEVRHPRAVVLKSKRRLHLFDGDKLVRTYRIALGRAPVGQKTKQDDGRTPEGIFRICTRNADSPYHRFLGVNYPDETAALRGWRAGLISRGEYREIMAAHADGHCPSWTTALGGGIGLHGRGADADWTAGCIALADADVEELFAVLRLGDEVEILP